MTSIGTPDRPSTNPRRRIRSYMLVAGQLGSLAGILLTGPLIGEHWATLLVELIGVAVGGWALVTMSIRHLHILPEVKKGSRLVTHGPYRWIRHPMYSALLLATLALILDHWSIARFGMWLVLLLVLLAKLTYEEQLLREAFPDYASYERRTFRLIPFVF